MRTRASLADSSEQPRILSSPPLRDNRQASSALAAIGLELSGDSSAPGTELDLVRCVSLYLDHDDPLTGIERLRSASRGALVTADLLALRYDRELRARDSLAYVNARLDPVQGRFFYTPAEDAHQVLFLAPEQAQALAARGWKFNPASKVG